YSLDNLSLMALVISTGFVVDDAIVVVENVSRYIEQGLSPMQSALRGAREVGFTVLSISISLVAVFTPILLMGGILGRLFREFAVTLSTAIIVSLIISLTATPMMCSRLLRHQKEKSHGKIYHFSESAFAWLLEHYKRALTVVLRHPAITLFVLILTIALNVVLIIVIPRGYFPEQDNGTVFGNIQGNESASYQSMQHVAQRVNLIATNDPAVAGAITFTGGSGPANSGFVYLALKPLNQRKISALQVVNRLRPKFGTIAGATVFLQPGQDLRMGGRQSSAQYQYTIQSENLDDLNKWGPILLANMKKLPGFTDVNSDQQNNGLQASLVYDRNTAARLGIPTQLIDRTLYDAFGQEYASTMHTPLNQYYVVLEVQQQFWQSPRGLDDIYLHATNSSAMVPLSAIAKYKPTTSAIQVNHTGQFPSVTISYNLTPGFPLGDAVNEIDQMMQNLKIPQTIHGSSSGTAAAYKSLLGTELMLVGVALLAVYIVLGIL
ncbi:MAG: efflux RND transporter permease subunit, partial [Limisphaerales bacterium]